MSEPQCHFCPAVDKFRCTSIQEAEGCPGYRGADAQSRLKGDELRSVFATEEWKWDEDFLLMSERWGQLKSKDPSTKVGALVVRERVVVGMGYNGFPRGVEDRPELLADRQAKYLRVVHAEANAIIQAGNKCEGATLYASMHPCHECSKLIIQAGIMRVVFRKSEVPDRWREMMDVSRSMLEEALVEVHEHAPE